MKVKALCNVLYGGKLYTAGQTFEADKPLNNVEVISGAQTDAAPASTIHLTDLFGASISAEKSTKAKKAAEKKSADTAEE